MLRRNISPRLRLYEQVAPAHPLCSMLPSVCGREGAGGGDGRGIATVDGSRLETVDLYGLCVQAEALLLVGEELLDILALVALELDHLAHLRVGNDGAIAGELLLDDFKDLLLVKLLGQALDRRQGLATIALYGGRLARAAKKEEKVRWRGL